MQVGIFVHRQKLARLVQLALNQRAVPRVDGDVGDAVFITRHEHPISQVAVQHIELSLDFHGEAVDGVFEFLGRVGIEMPKPTAEVRR